MPSTVAVRPAHGPAEEVDPRLVDGVLAAAMAVVAAATDLEGTGGGGRGLQGMAERVGLRALSEREVLEQVGRGLSDDEIGQALFLSPATARTYVSRLLTELGVRDRPLPVVLAYETGLIAPGR